MGRLRIAGACAVAAMAIAGAAAGAAAGATPGWYECGKASPKNTGNYSNSTCTTPSEPGKGKYVLRAGVGKKKAFKGKSEKHSAVVVHIETPFGSKKVSCSGATDGGTAAMPNLEEKVSVTFAGCEAEGKTCNTASAAAGEVAITGLKGELGYLSESPEKVGIRLESETSPGPKDKLAHVTCGSTLEFTVVGGVIGEQTGDVNQLSKTSAVTFTAEALIGEHEFDHLKYTPLINPLGWAEESVAIHEEIEKDLKGELSKIERPIIKMIICGELIEGLLHEKCSPEVYSGLDGKVANKGEDLEIKA